MKTKSTADSPITRAAALAAVIAATAPGFTGEVDATTCNEDLEQGGPWSHSPSASPENVARLAAAFAFTDDERERIRQLECVFQQIQRHIQQHCNRQKLEFEIQAAEIDQAGCPLERHERLRVLREKHDAIGAIYADLQARENIVRRDMSPFAARLCDAIADLIRPAISVAEKATPIWATEHEPAKFWGVRVPTSPDWIVLPMKKLLAGLIWAAPRLRASSPDTAGEVRNWLSAGGLINAELGHD